MNFVHNQSEGLHKSAGHQRLGRVCITIISLRFFLAKDNGQSQGRFAYHDTTMTAGNACVHTNGAGLGPGINNKRARSESPHSPCQSLGSTASRWVGREGCLRGGGRVHGMGFFAGQIMSTHVQHLKTHNSSLRMICVRANAYQVKTKQKNTSNENTLQSPAERTRDAPCLL